MLDLSGVWGVVSQALGVLGTLPNLIVGLAVAGIVVGILLDMVRRR